MIRQATPNDFDGIVAMSELFWQQTIYKEHGFDHEQCLKMIELAFEHELLIVGVDQDDNPISFMACVKAPLLAAGDVWYAVELAFYVTPDNRGSKHGYQMIKQMEKMVEDQGIAYLNMISMQSSMPQKVNTFYQSMGYTHTESTFYKKF